MEQKKLQYNPVAKAIPKVVIFEMLFMIPGVLCMVFVEDIGLYVGVALLVFGSLSGAGLLALMILKVKCPECGRATKLDIETQRRECAVCDIEWSLSDNA
ncbi:MAG: hypothetical protein HRU15_14395 [Planctomycetes bacterium]|nr:hypothetical protein [Planctomycetota bacterium]